jgi:NADPH-dependent glutamate synthase beta subunit-like oxidoreductase
VLELPWGFEIYSLLTRWNPLNLRRPLPLADSGRKVLVVGLGPSGLHARAPPDERRHTVVGIDG